MQSVNILKWRSNCWYKKGRTNDKQISVFDSTGIALQDLASAASLITKAKKKCIGTVIDF